MLNRTSELGRAPLALAAALSLLAGIAPAQSPDPFSSGARWSAAASPAEAWLPSAVTFASHGELVWHAAAGVNPRVALFDSSPFSTQLAPRMSDPRPGVLGVLSVTAGADETELYSLAQYPGGSAASRWNQISRYDLSSAHPDAPVWTRVLSAPGNGIARLAVARNAPELLAAAYDQTAQRIDLHWLSGADGSITRSWSDAAPTLRQVAASGDLSRVVFVVGAQARVVSSSGQLVHVELLSGATNALALSADGQTIAVGSGGRVRLLESSAGGWTLAREFTAGAAEIPTRVALSDDGETLAIGWWDGVETQRVRFQLWRTAANAPSYERVLDSGVSTLQNFPEVVAVTPDGRRAAFGAWGTDDSDPEALLVDRDSGVEKLALDLGGSVRSLALDASGTRLAIGFKHVHANLIGATGELRTFDTGEREIQIVEPVRPNGVLHAAAQRAGAKRVFFVLGPIAGVPTPFGTALGSLRIERSSAHLFARRADAAGRADLVLPVSYPWTGGELSLQAYFRGAGVAAFSDAVATPVLN